MTRSTGQPSLNVKCYSVIAWMLCAAFVPTPTAFAEALMAGVAKVDITNDQAGPANGRMYARALVVKNDHTTAVIVSVDAVAIGEIGYIKNNYLPNVRSQIERELKIAASNILINASHCHGIICDDVDVRTIRAIKHASQNLEPVRIGVGVGHENRIMENRRLKLKSGKEVDVRHAYSMPADDQVAEIGPIDPEIGLLRLDRIDAAAGRNQTLAVVYNFACHPIQGVPNGHNTADITGFSSQVIEDNLCDVALFVQGCGGDINPVMYKDVEHPRNAETQGNLLGLSALQGLRKIRCENDPRVQVVNQKLALPKADVAERIAAMESEQTRLLQSLKGTTLNLKTFMPLAVKYKLSDEFPSYYSHRYLLEKEQGRTDLSKLDADNRLNMKNYMDNILVMEQLTRVQTNLALLRKHHAEFVAAGSRTVDVELVGLRIGDFALITFPGELTVRIGLNIKKKSPHPRTFVAGYTNGYIYYAPTADQLLNVGGAQEDSDCILAPEWQEKFETRAIEILQQLDAKKANR